MKLLRRTLITLGIAGFLLCAATVLLFNRQTLGWQALSVPTGSMRPTMSPGSLVLVHRVPYSSLRVGDVITHTNPLTMHSTLTHRIIKVYKLHGIPAYITKGDANPSPDLPVVGGLVRGKMVWHVPYVGTWLMWAKTWPGITLLVYLPALLIMTEETRRLAAYLRKIKPYRLWELARPHRKPNVRPKLAMATGAFAVLVMGVGWSSASALLGTSNTVTLGPNNLSVASTPTGGGGGTGNCTSNTNVNVSNSSSQTGQSGGATSSGNTGGGSTTSGSVTNTNNSNISITVNGC
ncbi:MAG TPA: signal peptidase I [Candidatus Saccharimonadales bacterium]|nr:signal peptidase I [Candidatus Saccharimonadales bacterium]